MTDTALSADAREIVIDEVFPHAPATVWKTLATSDLMGRWLNMTPTGYQIESYVNHETVIGNNDPAMIPTNGINVSIDAMNPNKNG